MANTLPEALQALADEIEKDIIEGPAQQVVSWINNPDLVLALDDVAQQTRNFILDSSNTFNEGCSFKKTVNVDLACNTNSQFMVNNIPVVGQRQPAIPTANGTNDTDVINNIRARLINHGLVEP